MLSKRISLSVSFVLLSVLLTNCANHLRDENITTQENNKKENWTKYELILYPEKIQDSQYEVKINKLESVENSSYNVKTVKRYVTPYQGWREIYEFPAGVCLLPVSLGTHLAFLFTFGMVPYSVPKSINELSFTGMNIFLNWEDESRVAESLLTQERKLIDSKTEINELPLSDTTVIVKTEDLSRRFTTDKFGAFTLDFLPVNQENSFIPNSRRLSFILDSNNNEELKSIILTRDFLSRLKHARNEIATYNQTPSGGKLLETIIKLEKMGFEQLAYSLEENELKKHSSSSPADRKFKDDFQKASVEYSGI